MEVGFNIRDDKVKGLTMQLTPIESLIVRKALIEFAYDSSKNEIDRATAQRMYNIFTEAIVRSRSWQ